MPETTRLKRRYLRRTKVISVLGLAAAVGLGTGGLALVTGSAGAATPDQGTVTPSKASVTWTGGPFVAANTTGAAGDPNCSVPQSCDDFLLHVKTPAGYGKQHELKFSVGWGQAAADFDVYLLNEAGDIVATAASSADPETIVIPPNAGDYTLRVVPYAPLGESYQATATLRTIATNPPPAKIPAPKFTNYTAPQSFGDANNAGEPSIGNNFKTGATMYQAYLSTFKVNFDNSTPAKATWSDVSASATKGCPQGSTLSLDPILYTDHQTGRTFESQLTGQDSATCYTDDDGQSWLPSQGGGIPSGVDHQTIGGGAYAKSSSGSLPTSSYPNAVYYCSQDIAAAFCAASQDGGMTFGAGVPTYNMQQCGGLHGHLRVAPDGTAYLPNKGCGDKAAAVVSTDGGSSWTVRKVPGSTVGESDPSVGVGRDGTAYFGYTGANGKPAVAVSTDRGKTWKHNQSVGTEFNIKNSVFPSVIAGDDDRAAFAYIATPTGGNSQATGKFPGIWHLYISYTYDGGKSWVTSDATPRNPVQRGSICTGGTTCGNDRNLLDFMDITTDSHGRVIVGYADGCIGPCVNDASKNNHDAYATIARQSTGKPLFAKYDPKRQAGRSGKNLKVQKFQVHRHHGQFQVKAVVKNAGTRSVANIHVAVHDRSRTVRYTNAFSLRAGATRTVRVNFPINRRHNRHNINAVIDPRHLIHGETTRKDNKKKKVINLR